MKTALLAILTGFLVLSAIFTVIPAEAKQEGRRVLAFSDEQANNAVAKGCKIVQETKGLRALVCNPVVADALGLIDDFEVFAVDTGANTQIGASSVQTTNNGSGAKIVVLDTGCNYNHVELSDSCTSGKDFVNNDSDPLDDNGHGTHVAGLITANGVSSSAKGVAPNAEIISGKVLDASGSGYFSNIVAAMYWAVDGPNGISGDSDDFKADAISMSLGTSKTFKGTCDNYMSSMTNAINYAISKGTVVVVAAGNSGNAGVSFPGCISSALTVGAVDKYDKIASFSGRGSAVDVTAPGVSLYSTWLGTGYASASGTSMATPIVSGTVALVKSAHTDWTPAQVIAAIKNTAKDLGTAGFDNNYGTGRIRANLAVQ